MNKTDKCAILLHPTESQKVKFQELANMWVISREDGKLKQERKNRLPGDLQLLTLEGLSGQR